MRKISDSTIRRLSVYLRFLEQAKSPTISSGELARLGGTTSAQVRKDLSFFGSFGKRGLGYSVPELKRQLREILGLGKEWRVVIVGAGKIGAALAQYRGFRQRGFVILGAYDNNPAKVGKTVEGMKVSDIAQMEKDFARGVPDIVVLTVPAEEAQAVLDRVVKSGVKAVLNFAPTQLQAPADATVKTGKMAMRWEE